MIRGPENLIVNVSGRAVIMRDLPPWFWIVCDDDGMIWYRHALTFEWWGKPSND